MSEQMTPEEPLLATYLREAVEALRSREYSYSEAVKMHSSILGYQPTPELEEKARARVDEVSTRLILTRAALAFWERLAEINAPTVRAYPDGSVYVGGTVLVNGREGWGNPGLTPLGFCGPDWMEQEAIQNLTQALECRRRNEVGR